MLLQRKTETNSTPTVGGATNSAAYTPEEIAQAITELEKERHAARSEQEESAQLGAVLEQLQLDLPAALVAEQIQRARIARSLKTKSRRRRVLFAGMGGVVACLTVVGIFWRFGTQTVATPAQAAIAETTAASEALPAQSITPDKLVVVDRSSGEAVSKTLAEVPEGTHATISGDELLTLLGVPKEYYGTLLRPESRNWTVYRKNRLCYLHAYTTLPQTHAALLATPEIRLYNKNDARIAREEPAAAVAVDLPINAINQYTVSSQDAMADYQILNVHLGNVDSVSFPK